MSDTQPALSPRYFLNLEESQDGFALATFGKSSLPALSRLSSAWRLSAGAFIWASMALAATMWRWRFFLDHADFNALLVPADDVQAPVCQISIRQKRAGH